MMEWALYREHFCTEPMRAVWSEDATISAWVRFERALAEAQGALGIIPVEAAAAIGRIDADMLDRTRLAADMMLVGRPIVGLVRQLRELAGPEFGAFVHRHSATQDVIDSGMALQMAQGLDLIQTALGRVILGLEDLAARHPGVTMMGRTNGHHALPIRLDTKLGVWRHELARRRLAITEAASRGLSIQHVGPVGEMTGYAPGAGAAVRARMAQTLGLGVTEPHWQNARDGVADVATALGALCASLCKISHNANILCSTDVGEMHERHVPGRGASSSMPHKANPRASEFGEAVARLGRQRAEQIGEVTGHEHERSGGVWIAEWVIVPDVFLLTSGALHWAERLVRDLEIDTARMARTVADFQARHGGA